MDNDDIVEDADGEETPKPHLKSMPTVGAKAIGE